MYNPTLGRFMQLDPIEFESGDTNLYRAEENNPINRVDTLGLESGAYVASYTGRKPSDPLRLYINVVPNPTAYGQTDSPLWWSDVYSKFLSGSGQLPVNSSDLQDMVSKLQARVRPQDSIRKLVIRAHGSPNDFQVGRGGSGVLRISEATLDPASPGYSATVVLELHKLGRLLSNDAEIVLWVCSAGSNARLMQLLANTTGATVHALDATTDAYLSTLGYEGDWHTAKPGDPVPPPGTLLPATKPKAKKK